MKWLLTIVILCFSVTVNAAVRIVSVDPATGLLVGSNVTFFADNILSLSNAVSGIFSFTETDPIFTAWLTNSLTGTNWISGQLDGKANTNQNVSLFPNDALYVTATVTNPLADTNWVNAQLAGKVDTNATFDLLAVNDGSTLTGIVSAAFAENANTTTNALQLGGTPAAGYASTGAVTQVLTGYAPTNQNVSAFPNDALYVTATVTNGLPITSGTYANMGVGTATFSAFANNANTATNALQLGGSAASSYPVNGGAASFNNITNTALTASQYVSTGTGKQLTSWTLATPAWFHPGDPTGTTSNSYRAMGLGTTVHITPLFTGKVLFEFHFQTFQVNNTGTQAGQFILEYGSGTAPTNNQYGAVAGTTIGVITTIQSSVAVGSQIHDYGQSIIVTGLTPGTAYWFDVAMERTSGTATASVQGVTCVLMEVP